MGAQILTASQANLAIAAEALRRGALVAMPTETVYGLAGVAFNENAVAAIFAAKERPTFDPLICHIPRVASAWLNHLAEQGLVDISQLSDVAQQNVERLAKAFWPGPLTLVLPRQAGVPDLVTSGLPTVGVRCPRHEVAQQLLLEVGLPLAAPSANRFGRISPTAAAHVDAELGDRIPYILDGGDCEIGIESTVLLVEPSSRLVLLRPGAITAEQIERVTGCKPVTASGKAETSTPLPAPGMLASHYAPRKPLHLFARRVAALDDAERAAWRSTTAGRRIGILLMAGITDIANLPHTVAIPLSATGDVAEAARRLFARLRELDERDDVDEIWAELHPDAHGLAHAINDRLTKASHPQP